MRPITPSSSSTTGSSRAVAHGPARRIGPLLLAALVAGPGCASPDRPASPRPVRDVESLLATTWDGYRQRFIRDDGRVIRPGDGFDTVSEGQAYALLRAVWMDDRQTFDRVYRWTESHLSRQRAKGDHLLAWRWGRQKDGGWGVLDWTAASDADEDYALALLFAARRWEDPGIDVPPYRERALTVLADILSKATRRGTDGRLYLIPGDWNEEALIVNPSYFAPAWYRIFYEATNDPRWLELIESSYHAIDTVASRLEDRAGVGLMPDWAALAADGRFVPAGDLSDAHGWDAFRAAWRVGLDWLWFKEPRAHRYLAGRLYPFLKAEWDRNGGRLPARYSYEGTPLVTYESPTTYAGYLAAFLVAGSPVADELLEKLRGAVRRDAEGDVFEPGDDYYLNNWAWFGLLLGGGRAANLWLVR
jgi:endo-1,4-beta-D-glucanase Y